MFTGGSHELGYASTALVIALINSLVTRKILTKDEAFGVLNDATSSLGQMENIGNIAGAIQLIENDVRGEIAA